jgi:hypothetical protein
LLESVGEGACGWLGSLRIGVFAVMLITPRFCFSRAASANFVILIPSFSSGGSIFFLF